MRSAKRLGLIVLAAGAAVMLAACGGGSSTVATNTSGTQGTLIFNPPARVGSVNVADFTASLALTTSGQQLLGLLTQTGLAPVCGIDFHYIQYNTVGGAGEATTGSGALMVPTGAAGCTGNRPIVLYAHGTASTRGYNIANPNDSTNEAASESGLIAAVFAARGYIVVAPNYPGYDSSSLPYHPFINANAQAQDMIYALEAARTALGRVPASGTLDGGKLFISGYSEGGFVAMATHRAMQAQSMTVTASAPMSGPYATAAFLDAIFFGDVNLGSTEFFPLIISSAQNSYKSRPLYAATSDIIESAYASGFDTLLPGLSFSTLVQQGKLPLTQLFNSTPPVTGDPTLDGFFLANTPPTTPPAEAPLFALGFGANNLVKNSFRAAYVADALTNMDGEFTSPPTGLPSMNPVHPLRIDAALSDLRTWVPTTAPVLMCGGTNDPTVFYPVNTGAMQTLWSAELPALGTPQYLNVLDIDGVSPSVYPAPLTPLYTALQAGFAGAKAADPNAVQDYHGTLVPPFCMVAVQTFFSIQP